MATATGGLQQVEPTTEQVMAKQPRRKAWLAGLVVAVVLLGGGGVWYWLDNRPATPPPGNLTVAQRAEIFTAFWDMANKEYPDFATKHIDWNRVRTTYTKLVRRAPDDDAFNDVMLRAVGELKDTHDWLYIPRVQNSNVNLLLAMDGDKVVIRQVIAGSDADQAGFKAGMEIVAVDGKPAASAWQTSSLRLSDTTAYRNRWIGARYMLIGKLATTVQVSARGADGKLVTATLARRSQGVSPRPPFEGNVLDGGIMYMRFASFDDAAVMLQVYSFMQRVAKQQPPGLIIDVRGNGGGDADFGQVILNYLAKTPLPWTYELGKSTGLVGPSMSQPKDPAYEGPVLVLTDPGCVSACDILTANLQRNGRAKLVGEPPAGASNLANDRKLPYGYVIHLSGGRAIWGPDKQPIEGHPAAVAYPVAPTAADWAAGRDPVLEKALQLFKK